jgi:hypothetical protein
MSIFKSTVDRLGGFAGSAEVENHVTVRFQNDAFFFSLRALPGCHNHRDVLKSPTGVIRIGLSLPWVSQ